MVLPPEVNTNPSITILNFFHYICKMDIERTSSSIPEQQQPSSTNEYYIDLHYSKFLHKNPYSFVLADGVAPFQVLGTIELLIDFAACTN